MDNWLHNEMVVTTVYNNDGDFPILRIGKLPIWEKYGEEERNEERQPIQT